MIIKKIIMQEDAELLLDLDHEFIRTVLEGASILVGVHTQGNKLRARGSIISGTNVNIRVLIDRAVWITSCTRVVTTGYH